MTKNPQPIVLRILRNLRKKDWISENVVSLRKFIGLYALVPGSESGKFKKHRKKSYKVCAYGRRLFVFRYAWAYQSLESAGAK